jgi:hypothetical protein
MIMAIRKALFLVGLLALFSMLLTAAPVWSGFEGNAPEPTDWSKVVGPELWAVVVMSCGGPDQVGTMRVKRIYDCNVETDTLVDFDTIDALGCLDNERWYLYARFPKSTFFDQAPGIPAQNGNWIITKIKNFSYKQVGLITTVSFDAQIKFELE